MILRRNCLEGAQSVAVCVTRITAKSARNGTTRRRTNLPGCTTGKSIFKELSSLCVAHNVTPCTVIAILVDRASTNFILFVQIQASNVGNGRKRDGSAMASDRGYPLANGRRGDGFTRKRACLSTARDSCRSENQVSSWIKEPKFSPRPFCC